MKHFLPKAHCEYCGDEVFTPGSDGYLANPKKQRTKDHYVPRLIAGNEFAFRGVPNGRICCLECNQVKGDGPPSVFKTFVKFYKGTPQFTQAHFKKLCFVLSEIGFRAVVKDVLASRKTPNPFAPDPPKGKYTQRDLRRKKT